MLNPYGQTLVSANKSIVNMNLAIISPGYDTSSETFIQAHKRIPGVTVFFYYGGMVPKFLEGHGPVDFKTIRAIMNRTSQHRDKRTNLSLPEEALMKSFKQHRIDCVLAEYGTTAVSVLNVCRTLKLPLIAHFHGFDASVHLVVEKNLKAYQKLFDYASSIIAVSRAMEKKLLDLGCPASKLLYTACAPDDAFLDVKPTYRKKQFVGIGRFVDKKAPYYTLLAFQSALSAHPDAQLIIGGEGPLLNTCNNLVKHLKLEKNVVLPGFITPGQYREHLAESRAYVQHSITAENGDMEGTPVGILEASAAGLPVISTFHAGIPDVITHGNTGLLCEEHDVGQMAAHMVQLINNKQLAIALGAAGKENIRNNYSMDRHLGVLAEAVQKALND